MDPTPRSTSPPTPPVRPMQSPTDPGPPADPPLRTGDYGEALAAQHLTSQGLEIVARNWRLATGDVRGELDLVALDHGAACVVVVEVKTRRGDGWGGPLAAIGHRKRATLRRLALAFMVAADLPYRQVRIDVVGVRLDTRHLHHVVDAL